MKPTMTTVAAALALPLALAGTATAESPQHWYDEGQRAVAQAKALQAEPGRAKNIILFIGDGMGLSTVTAARILEGQLRGEPGEENRLSFETLPYVALSKTYNTNQQTPDSAGAMTAMMSGVKTKAGVIGLDQRVTRGECTGAHGHRLPTFLEQAETAGKVTGIVTTAQLTHATPAATYAHSPERHWEDDHDMPREAIEKGCKDIARQLIEFSYGDGLEVALGGGRRSFWPRNQPDPEDSGQHGQRDDGRNLTEEWQAKYNNAAFVWNRTQFNAVDSRRTDHLLGLFEQEHMEYESDRPRDSGGEPSLSEMTVKAIDILARNKNGFFLMVESGRIDHAHHAGNAYRALTETIELAGAVGVARKLTDAKDTLIIVTADHSSVFTIAGYPTRGNPILGKVIANDKRGNAKSKPALAKDGQPYTTLGYHNGQGFAFHKDGGIRDEKHSAHSGRDSDLSGVDTGQPGYHQQALVPLKSVSHGGEDVAIYAGGPGAHLIHGVQEQNVIYHVMREAAGL